jgi:predicted DNA-binding transcriptional regulator YafY
VHDHQLYVVARDGEGELHPYRFSRIRSVDVLDESFSYPDRLAYDPEQVFRDSFGIFLGLPVQDIELRLHKQWATYAQSHRWHDSQRVDVAGDHVVVRMRVSVCPELVAWILGFGEQAEVLAPAELRGQMAKRGAALGALYGGRERVASRPSLRKAGGSSVEESGRGRKQRR